MAEREEGTLCDICHRRPAAVRVTVSEDGRRRTLDVCEQDYARLEAQNATPFESLFGGGLFGDDFMGGIFGGGGSLRAASGVSAGVATASPLTSPSS
jgi:ATP-dependent Clp protease ATP-binding subunit ClpC